MARREAQVEGLLEQLRHRVVQLQLLEGAADDESDLDASRQAVEELHWRLARVVANSHDDDHPQAA